MWKLRRVLGGLDPRQAIELLTRPAQEDADELRVPHQVQQTSSARLDDD